MASPSATGPGARRQSSEIGYVVRLTSYNEAEAVVLDPGAPSLYRGSLLHVYDASTGSHYIAVVSDISETEPHPAPDPNMLQQVLAAAAQARAMSYHEALREILSPGSPLALSTSIVVKLSILARLCERSDSGPRCAGLDPRLDPRRVVVADVERPPRPRSIVSEPDEDLLRELLGRRCAEPAMLGELRQVPGVEVCLDLSRINMHLAVVGQTGFGKTETVKRIVYEALGAWRGRWDRRGVIVMDVSGEYTGYPQRPPPPATPLVEAAAAASRLPDRVTVIIPYDPRRATLHHLASGTLTLYSTILGYGVARGSPSAVLVLHPRGALVLASSGVRVAGRSVAVARGLSATAATRHSVYRVLAQAHLLVLAAPLPDALPLQLVEELGAFDPDAEYTSLLYEAAEALGGPPGVLESLHLLELLTSLAVDSSTQSPQVSATQLINDACSAAQRGPRAVAQALYDGLARSLGARPQQYRRQSLMPLYVHLLGPRSHRQLLHACSSQQPPRWLSARASSLARLAAVLASQRYGRASRLALLRRLRRLAAQTAPHLDAHAATLLARRAMQGLTVVHLAPPSVGRVEDTVVAWLLHRVFDEAVARYDPQRRIMVVVEEAHNLAPSREEKYSRDVLARYAREGRKWGLGLVTVTQRPAGLDPTILSQAATLIALRVTNPDDIQALRAGAESATQPLIERLPDLDRGEVVLTGIAAPERRIPLQIRVRMVT